MDAESAAAQFGHMEVARWMREEKEKKKKAREREEKSKRNEQGEEKEALSVTKCDPQIFEKAGCLGVRGKVLPPAFLAAQRERESCLRLRHNAWRVHHKRQRRYLEIVLDCIPPPMFVHPQEIPALRTRLEGFGLRGGAAARALSASSAICQSYIFFDTALPHVGYSLQDVVTPLSVSLSLRRKGRHQQKRRSTDEWSANVVTHSLSSLVHT